ncbi:FadR/GntR family transcriptional regulator [Brachybacterium sp. DNPG3]
MTGPDDPAHRFLTAPGPPPGAAGATALPRETLTDRVRQAVLDLIDDDGLTAGDPLPSTAALAERFAVSKAVIREALSALHALGIIEISNGRSATVRALDPSVVRLFLSRALRDSTSDSFRALMDLRAPLEAQAAALAARAVGSAASVGSDGADESGESGESGEIAALRALIARMGEVLGDSAAYPQLDLELHQRIAQLSGNRALLGVLDAVQLPLFRAMQVIRAARDEHGLVGAEHEDHVRIVDAILAGDAETAAHAMEEHMHAVDAMHATRPTRSA